MLPARRRDRTRGAHELSATYRWLGATLATLALGAGMAGAPGVGEAHSVVGAAGLEPGAAIYVNGVSCTLPAACVAVGATDASSSQALAWMFQASAWQPGPLPSLAGSSRLTDVSCPASGLCMAVGEAHEAAIALHLSGGVWTPMAMPASDRSADLFGVSCPTGNWCMAAGVGDGEKRIASAVFAGGRWRTGGGPAIKGALHFTLNALSCTSPRFCMAVGDTTLVTSGRLHGALLTALYNGSSWRIVTVGLAFGRTLPSLNGVACPRAGECIAVGNTNFYSATPGQQLIIHFHGGRWSPMTARAGTGTEPLAVSCPPAGTCVAVGVKELGAPVVERLAHGSWSMLPAQSAGPPTVGENGGIFDDTLESVSCSASDRCVAVGEDDGSPFSELIGPAAASLLTMPVA